MVIMQAAPDSRRLGLLQVRPSPLLPRCTGMYMQEAKHAYTSCSNKSMLYIPRNRSTLWTPQHSPPFVSLALCMSLQAFAAGLMLSLSFFDLLPTAISSIGFLKANIWVSGEPASGSQQTPSKQKVALIGQMCTSKPTSGRVKHAGRMGVEERDEATETSERVNECLGSKMEVNGKLRGEIEANRG